MLVVVGERRKEIGLRKAVGATSGRVFGQFLLEAVVVAVGAGLAGAALGLGSVQLWAAFRPPNLPFQSPPVLDPLTTISLIASLIIVGVISGVLPALSAARVPPAEALRSP